MGYSTDFDGELKFTCKMTGSDLAKVKDLNGADLRQHPEWDLPPGEGEFYYIALELTDDFSGIQWDGSEKATGMVDQVNAIIHLMRKTKKNFGLKGEMLAQGEEALDRWKLVIKDGKAVEVKLKIEGAVYRCPECGHAVITSEAELIES